jgi:hypothetical protein
MAVEGRRKDFWLWAQRKHVERAYKDRPDKIWDWMKKTVPSKYAESFLNQQKAELGLDLGARVNVLVCNFPEPRQLASDVKELDVIAVDGCKADSTETPTQIMDKLKELDSNDLSKPEEAV